MEFDAPAVTCPGFAEDIYSRFQSQARICAHAWAGCNLACLPACLPAQQGGGILCSGLHNFVAAHVASAHRASILQVGRLANLFPLYLFTPWVEDSLQVGQALTSTTAGVRRCMVALKS